MKARFWFETKKGLRFEVDIHVPPGATADGTARRVMDRVGDQRVELITGRYLP